MSRRLIVLLAIVATLVVGTGIATALVRSGGDASAPPATTTTIPAPTTTVPAPTTTAPSRTTVAAVTTTTRRVTTTRPPATTTVTVAPTTTKPALTRAAATQGLCSEIETSVRQVVDGSTFAGGLRLVRALNTYGDTADPAVVVPARRMASTGLSGDLDASAAATQEAAAACRRLGYPVNLSGPVQCITAPCP
jgi:hypothetical protein